MEAEHSPGLRGWLRNKAGSVRVRTTIAAILVVGLTLAAGAVALIVFLSSMLMREVEASALLRATDVVHDLDGGVSAADLTVADPEETVIQVLDADGEVVASSPNYVGRPPVADLSPGESTIVSLPIEEHKFLVVAVGATGPDRRMSVLLARTLESVEESTEVVAGLLISGLPLILVVTAATMWAVVGRALAPVESIREEVEEISASELHRRVPAPLGTDEIARLASTMNRMLERLEQSQARQRRFISDASHELRSPVATIRQHAEVALAHPDRVDTVELAEVVLAEDLRVERLVGDMLLLARADESSLSQRLRRVDLDDVVFEEARRLRETTRLEVDTGSVSAGRTLGDPASLRRMIRNLGENAVRHAVSRVSFSLHQINGVTVLRVDDDGPGIPAEKRRTIFERFVRLDDARARDAGGSGLGLAIVSEIVDAHGGRIEVGDSPLGGARFEMHLPGVDDSTV